MDYRDIATLSEAKEYFKRLWQPMESEYVLSNLQKVLNFLQSHAEEACFVNMPQKYLPFYYMILLDEHFLQTTFLTDECKVVANEILRTLEVNKSSFSWEVSFSTKITGILVLFRKVFPESQSVSTKEYCDRPIHAAFKKTWVDTTLKFIKSSHHILKYPEMPRREAQYLYNSILKLNDEEIDSDTLWSPVWEALNIFKLRYEYIISIYSASFDYLKFVHFEKVAVQRRNCEIEDKNLIALSDIEEQTLLSDSNSDSLKDTVTNGHEKDLVNVGIDHNELIKFLLKINVTKSETVIYTLNTDASNMATNTTNAHQKEVNQSPDKDNVIDEIVKLEATIPNTNLPDGELANVNLTLAVKDEVNAVPVQDTELSNDSVKYLHEELYSPDIKCTENKNADTIDLCEDTEELEIKITSCVHNENVIEDSEPVVISQIKTDASCDIETQVIEINSLDDFDIGTDDKNSSIIKSSTPETNVTDQLSQNINPFLEQIAKLQKQNQNQALYLKQEDFIKTEDVNDLNCVIDDVVLRNKMESINSNKTSDNNHVDKRFEPKKKKIPVLSAKAQLKLELKMQRRVENKVRQKQRLIASVPTSFIQTSFKAILDFINDELRASIEIGSLNIQEFNVLKKLNSFAPEVAPLEKLFNSACLDLAVELFGRLNEMNEFLEIKWVKPSQIQRIVGTDKTRQRAVTFIKRPFKKPRNVQQKSILDRSRSDTPAKSISRGSSSLILSSEGNVSRSASVSPARPVSCARTTLENLEQRQKPLDPENTDKPMRTSASPAGNLVVKMKAQMLEGLAMPLESDKAIRMMRLMGWNGGALGLRGEGLIEPIQPQLHVPRGVGLGHKMFKSTKLNFKKLQKKVMQEKCRLEKNKEAAIVGNNSRNNSYCSKDDAYNVKDNVFNGPNESASDRSVKQSLQITINNNVTNKIDSSEIATHSNDDKPIDIESSCWLTNESLLQKIKVKNVGNVMKQKKINAKESKGKKGTNAKDSTDDGLSNSDLEQRNREVVRVNHEKLMRSLQKMNEEGHARWRVAGDEKLEDYTCEHKSACLSDRVQFLVHLLHLLQCVEKTVSFVSYVRKPTEIAVKYIEAIISSLNKREKVLPLLPSEDNIADACSREMNAHRRLRVFYRFRKRLLVLVKSDDSSYANSVLAQVPNMAEYEFEITHYVNDYRLYRQMPQGAVGVTRTKIFTNRVILEFVKSDDQERVYYYGRSQDEIRTYIISLISLLNRRMADFQLGLGNSEHPVFRETLSRMKTFCLLFRFDTQQAYFNKLQLVKVDMSKMCRRCRMGDETIKFVDETVDVDDDNCEYIDDVDIYPNRFHKSTDEVILDGTEIEKKVESTKLNEIVCEDKECDIECNDDTNTGEVYLIGEDWLDVSLEINKNESSSKTYLNTSDKSDLQKCNEEDSDVQSKNISLEETSADFHKWPKRVKKDLTNNNVVDTERNMTDGYERNVQDLPKRKVTIKQKIIEDAVENRINLDDTDKTLDKPLDFQHDKVDESNNNEDNVEFNAEVKSNVTSNDMEAAENYVKSDTVDSNIKTLMDNSWPKNILIVHHNYPQYKIDSNSAIDLQSVIYEATKKYSFLPRLKCRGLKDGGIVYTCYNVETYIWLYDNLHRYNILGHDEIQPAHIIELKIKTFIKLDVEDIMKNIERFYDNIKTDSWKVIERRDLADCCLVAVEVDGPSLEVIREENYSLFVGVDKADVRVVYEC